MALADYVYKIYSFALLIGITTLGLTIFTLLSNLTLKNNSWKAFLITTIVCFGVLGLLTHYYPNNIPD